MSFKKIFTSNSVFVIGDSSNQKDLFPPGFRYCLGGTTYTVKSNVSKDPNSELREVFLSDGSTEILPIETIMKDLKDSECVIMEPDKRFVEKKSDETQPEKDVNKNIKKDKKKESKNNSTKTNKKKSSKKKKNG